VNRLTRLTRLTRTLRSTALLAASCCIVGAHLPSMALAQSPRTATDSARASRVVEGGLNLTVFRNPASGLEYRRGAFAVHGGFYPTILKADGQDEGENTNFLRAGLSTYRRPSGFSHYASVALLVSLDDDWENGIISEVGVRAPFARRFAARLGVGVLTSFDGEVRVNPTVGLDVRLGGR
jgi:hypothetical protein